ncbi:unnamed protein product [Coccothraustes coccothraustes]
MVSPAPGCFTRPGLTRGPDAIVSPARSDLLGRERPRVPPARPGRLRSVPTWRVLPRRSPPRLSALPRARTGRGCHGCSVVLSRSVMP